MTDTADSDQLEAVLGDRLTEREETVAVVESLTGGRALWALLRPRAVRGVCEHRARIERVRAARQVLLPRQTVRATDHLVDRPEPHLGHDLAELLCDEQHEVDHVVRLAGEPLAEVLTLGGDPDRTGVLVTLPSHHAAGGDERRRAERELLGTQEDADSHVAAGHHAAVRGDANPVTQARLAEHLVRLRQPEFPRQTGVFDARPR